MFSDCIKADIHPITWAVLGVTTDSNGVKTYAHLGTAFAVDTHGHLLTCHHVTFKDRPCTETWANFMVVQPELDVSRMLSASLVTRDPGRDLALLKIDDVSVRTRSARLYGGTPSFGKSCAAFGHPLSTHDAATQSVQIFTRASGGIVSTRLNAALGPGLPPTWFYELDFMTHGGASGAPVFLRSGDVFGVVSRSLRADDGNGNAVRSNLTWAIDAREAVEFLKPIGIQPQIRGGGRR